MTEFLKYHGAGNDFLLYDARTAPEEFPAERIAALCDRHTGVGADGLMILSMAEGYDFRMEFFNPDGSGGMMCGNGGRCIVAFARDLGLAPGPDGTYHFLAPDGPHTAWLLSDDGPVKTVRLGMKDVTEYYRVVSGDGNGRADEVFGAALRGGVSGDGNGRTDEVFGAGLRSGVSGDGAVSVLLGGGQNLSGWFLDTGTRHFVTFVDSVDSVDVEGLGRTIRHLPEFGPVGVNVNFVEIIAPGEIAVRTFEKGVEAETLACGTGITASAIASWLAACPAEDGANGAAGGVCVAGAAVPACAAGCAAAGGGTDAADAAVPACAAGIAGSADVSDACSAAVGWPTTILVHARRHDLAVSFTPSRVGPDISFVDVTLTGPAERVARILLP